MTRLHVLLNLLNKLRKSDKMRGLPIISLLFHNKFNKFNNTGAGMLDSIYHMTFKLIKNHIWDSLSGGKLFSLREVPILKRNAIGENQ